MPRHVLVTGAAGFAGSHCWICSRRPAPTIVAWHRPGGIAARVTSSGCAGKRSICSIADAVRAAIARTRPSTVYHCAGAAHVGRAWDTTESTFAINVRGTHHLLRCARRASSRRCACAESRARRSSTRRPTEALTEDASAGAAQPVRRQQAGAGDARRVPVDGLLGVRSRERSTTSVRGRIRSSPLGLRAADRRHRDAGAGNRRSRSATSTRAANSPTSATRCAPTR